MRSRERSQGFERRVPWDGRLLAFAALAAGLSIVLVAQRAVQFAGPPLYDGIIVTDPYRWLSPPPGQLGGAQGASGTEAVHGDSPVVAIATPEEPPQAQIFAPPGSLLLPPGTTELKLSIEPVPPGRAPPDGSIAGNVYRISVVNQADEAISGRSGEDVTVVLRGPPAATNAVIERFSGGSWRPVQTQTAGLPATYLAVVTDFGDFAVVVPAAVIPPPIEPSISGSPSAAKTTGLGKGGSTAAPPLPLGLLIGGAAVAAAAACLLVATWRLRRRS